MNIEEFLTHVATVLTNLPHEIQAHLLTREETAAALGRLKAVADGVVKLGPLLGPEGAAIAGAVAAGETVAEKVLPVVEEALEGGGTAARPTLVAGDPGAASTAAPQADAAKAGSVAGAVLALVVAGGLLLGACTGQQAALAQQDACWIQSVANAAGAIGSSSGNGQVAGAAAVLSQAAGVECLDPLPEQAAPAAAPAV